MLDSSALTPATAMLATLLIIFRESIDAGLNVSIVLAKPPRLLKRLQYPGKRSHDRVEWK